MKYLKKISALLLSLLLFFGISVPVQAENTNAYFSGDYTYTVRVFSGAQGTFSDGSSEMIIRVSPGTMIDLTRILAGIHMNSSVDAAGNVIESKYYPKGIRESGKDNNTVDTLIGPVFHVTRDIDLVVGYAIRGGNVSYTVKYLNEETMEELFPTQTFFGNVGEKPVVAYQYIDGYLPQAYNLARTLVEDESQNVFTFLYKKGNSNGYYYYETDGGIIYVDREGETTVEFIPGTVIYVTGGGGGVTVVPGGNGNANGNVNGNANGNADNINQQGNQENPDNQGEVDENVEIIPEEVPESDGPVDLIDLDTDESVPLASGLANGNAGGLSGGEGASKLFNPLVVGLMALGVAAVTVTTGVVYTKKKKLAKSVTENTDQKAGDNE